MDVPFQIKSSTVEKAELVELRKQIEAQSTLECFFKGRTKTTRMHVANLRLKSRGRRGVKKMESAMGIRTKRSPAPRYMDIVQATYDNVNIFLGSGVGHIAETLLILPIAKAAIKWAKQRFKQTKRRHVVNLFGPTGRVVKTIEIKK
jgi:hypothetical protein